MSEPGYWKEAHLAADCKPIWELAGFEVINTSIRRSQHAHVGIDPDIPDTYIRKPLDRLGSSHRIWIEYKLEGKWPRDSQALWHGRERRAGGRVWVIHSLEEAVASLGTIDIYIELTEVD